MNFPFVVSWYKFKLFTSKIFVNVMFNECPVNIGKYSVADPGFPLGGALIYS